MQLLQPLTVQHVGLAPGHVLDAPGVHQHHFKSPLFQHPEQRYPVHPSRLHYHGLHSALRQPASQAIQVRREGGELLHRLCGAVGRHRHEMAAGPHIDARRVQICLGKLRWQTLPPTSSLARRFCAPLACSHHLTPYHGSVGASPEEVTDSSHSPERDRPDWGVTNDAAVRLPDHALYRAICTKV